MTADGALARFNDLSDLAAAETLRACCAAPVWIESVSGGRPYLSRRALLATVDEVLVGLDWSQILVALAAHPRIGERVGGTDRESAWSRREQSGMDHASTDVLAALVQANRDYEERFGHVFLIFATGRTDTEMLAAARQRLANDEATEHEVVREQLRSIVGLRVTKLLDEPVVVRAAATAVAPGSLSTHVLDTAEGVPAHGVPVRLELAHDGGWREIAAGVTDDDGRLRDWVPAEHWHTGTYRLTFQTAARSAFFPEISVVFFVAEPARHHHVPLLLSPYGYSTYRGS